MANETHLPQHLICASDALTDSGQGVRFGVTHQGVTRPAFVIRFEGEAHAYLNRCAHIPVELDWQEGDFFDRERQFLICSTHGAIYSPTKGICLAGPCTGQRLIKINIIEADNNIYWIEG